MFRQSLVITLTLLAGLALDAQAAPASTTAILDKYTAQAKQANPAFHGFSAEEGKRFFYTKHMGESCASCHSDNVKAQGKHSKTGKAIDPLAPSANPDRFTDAAKVEKWFKRNCNDVFQRVCTAEEKGDVMTWLLSVK